MRDFVELKLSKTAWKAISILYQEMLWEGSTPETWAFEDVCALYFRVLFYRDCIPDGGGVACTIREAIQAFLEDELA